MSISINALAPATLYAVSVAPDAPLWADLAEDVQQPYIDAGMFLTSFLNGANLRAFKRETAEKALIAKVGKLPEGLSAEAAVHIYFQLASAFA